MGNFSSFLLGEAITGHEQQRPETKIYFFSLSINKSPSKIILLMILTFMCIKARSFIPSNPRQNYTADSAGFTVPETSKTAEKVQHEQVTSEETKKLTMVEMMSVRRDDHEIAQEKRRERKNLKKVIKNYSSSQRILLVGEGDFSFSTCLAVAFGNASNMIATSLNKRKFLEKNYQNAMSNIEELESRGCKVMHGIDATEMANHDFLKDLKFDRIVFNFPFAGFFKKLPPDSVLHRHRSLVSKFLMNAKKMISEDGEIHISHKTNGVHNEWNLESIASSHGLRLMEAVKFNPLHYPGYNTKRGFGGDENFNCYPSKTFKFGLKTV